MAAVSKAISLDAPIAGWDAFHSLDNMPPDSAIVLDNLIPGAGSVDTRKGSLVFADTLTGEPVETLASFASSTETSMVAASAGGLFQILPDSTIAQITAAGTYANNRWQFTNFRKLDETGVMLLANGEDVMKVYDGTTTIADIDSTGTTDPAYDGKFIGCITFKGRIYAWNDNDNSIWYTQAGSYQGEWTAFELGTTTQRGGKLILATTWTQQDSGDGKDDFIVFVFSTGEILVYQGDDPDTAGFFEMVGRYVTGEPLSIRGSAQYGADAILMTKDGYISLSTIIQEGRTSDVPAFSRLIHTAITNRTAQNSGLYGWECELFPAQGLFVFNVPTSENNFEQHVMNTVTQRWCRFQGFNVNCMTVNNDRLFGGLQNGQVISMLEGENDDGEAIQFTALYGFNYLGNPGVNKHIVAAQILSTNDDPKLFTIAGYADFQTPVIKDVTSPTPYPQGIWSPEPAGPPPSPFGSAWDTVYWSTQGQQFTSKGWQNVSAYGYAVALLIRFAKVNEGVIWRSTNVRFFEAGSQ
jgi:hypothetical protein